MPRVRESLNQTKTRLQAEQKQRTDRRVRELLKNNRLDDQEILDDSEEADRLSARQARLNRDKPTQTYRSFCCGVLCFVFLVACFIACLLLFIPNDRQRVAE